MTESLEFLRPESSPINAGLPWLAHHDEGELAVDVLETEKAIFVKTAIAGVKPEDLSLTLSHDMLTIRGTRHDETNSNEECRYLSQECHWGAFSRSIILPAEVNVSKAEAIFKSGILAIKLPKQHRENEIRVRVEE